MCFQRLHVVVTLVFCGALTGELYTLAEPRLEKEVAQTLRERRASQLEMCRKSFCGEETRNRPRPSKAVDRLVEIQRQSLLSC